MIEEPHEDCKAWHSMVIAEDSLLRDRVEELTAERDWLRSVVASLIAPPLHRVEEAPHA